MTAAAVDEKAAFLSQFAPFSALDGDEVARVAASVEVRSYRHGAVALVEGAAPATSFSVIRSGSMELVHEDQVVDVFMPGEGFGHPSLLSGFASAFTVCAREDAVCFLVPRRGRACRPGAPVRRAVRGDDAPRAPRRPGRDGARALPPVAGARVTSLVTRAPVFSDAEAPIRSVAREMSDRSATAVLVRSPAGLGIVTDADIRRRVAAEGVPVDAPVGEIATSPVVTVSDRALALDAMVDMLEAGIHHLPVVDGHGEVIGIASADDLMNLESRSPFALRRALEHAPDVDALADAAAHLPDLVVVLVEAGLPGPEIGLVLALQSDTATTRLVDLAIEAHGEPPVAWAWLALGSVARREVTPASDQDNALAYAGAERDPEADAYFERFAGFVNAGLARCGFGPDEVHVLARDRRWRMAEGQWRAVFRDCLTFPSRPNLVRALVSFDFRHVAGGLDIAASLVPLLRSAKDYREFLTVLARNAVEYRPPLGFRGHLAVGRRDRTIDVKAGGTTPIANLARFYALANGITISSTVDRLAAAEDVGALRAATAQSLREAFASVLRVRLENQAAQLRAGRAPDNLVRPDSLPPLARTELREALRAIAGAQKQLSRVAAFSV